MIATPLHAAPVDCSEAYGGKPTACEQVTCNEKYKSFIGTWSGDFEVYSRELSKDSVEYRPYHNTVAYSEMDCLKNTLSGDTFIIGRKTDTYAAFKTLPGKTTTGLIITGRKADDTPFLRTIDAESGINDYQLTYQNSAANLSIWTLTVEGTENSPKMSFTIIDGQDFSDTSTHKRNVTITMTIGPTNAPLWDGVIVNGSHSKK